METIRTISWMKEAAQRHRAENQVIGLVPTMGALHEGHISLVRRARKECSRVYASIFVNPKQFGPREDLAKYPRTLDADLETLETLGVNAVFVPEPLEIYPPDFRTYVTVEGLSDRLEGRTRPGHFRGVSTIVLKLFEIVQPHFAYFGRKDAQQVRIIQQMIRDLNLAVETVVCPIVRESDGLALSSRNAYLDSGEREAATVLHRALAAVQAEIASSTRDALNLQNKARDVLQKEKLASLDYAEVVDANTFEPVTRVSHASYFLLAAFVGTTRLIDNLLIEPMDDSGDLVCRF